MLHGYEVVGRRPDEDDSSGWILNNPKQKELEARKARRKLKEKENKLKEEASGQKTKTNVQKVEEPVFKQKKVPTSKIYEKYDRMLQEASEDDYNPKINNQHQKIMQDKKKKKPTPKHEEKVSSTAVSHKNSLENLSKEFDVKELQSKVGEIKGYTDPQVRLKLLAEHFENHFHDVQVEKKPSQSDLPSWATKDKPYAYFSKSILSTMSDFLKKFEDSDLSAFVWFLFTTLVSNKSSHIVEGVGSEALLQIIVKQHPHTVADIVPKLQEKYFSKSAKGYTLKDNFQNEVMELVGLALSNPTVSLYCWLELLLPAVTIVSTHVSQCEMATKYAELAVENYKKTQKPKKSKKNEEKSSTAPNFASPNGLLTLMKFISSKDRSQNFNPRVTAIYNDILSNTLAAAPSLYIPTLLHSAAKYVDEEKSEVNLVLSALVSAILSDPSSVSQVADNYTKNIEQVNNLIYYLSIKWSSHVSQFPVENVQKASQQLTSLTQKVKSVNQDLSDNKYKENGKSVGTKMLGVNKNTLDVVTSSCVALEHTLKTTPVASKSSVFKSLFKLIFYFLLFVVVLVILGKNKLIPERWVEELLSYVPKQAIDLANQAQKQLGL
eukprot:TRINITY_DN6376_c0_g1_i1.p1 TRINITY_DN6376_c0_g1~~TRINITY_DN6376_c0_g1_i1.p1  ORF type:complete len:606 (+),score=140.11 TRINITY_DN6376_c0_g1_i1:32-1849(+)